jgi:hypothetical protein
MPSVIPKSLTDAESDGRPRSAVPGVHWTEDARFDREHAATSPDAPGVLVLLRGDPSEEVLVWAEDVGSLRRRAGELLGVPQRGELGRVLVDAPPPRHHV